MSIHVKLIKIKGFTISETIISLLLLSICISAVNPLLTYAINFLTNLKTKTITFNKTKNLESCYAAYKDQTICDQLN